jgi:hypothetical protein
MATRKSLKFNVKTSSHSTHPLYTLTTWQEGKYWFYQVNCPQAGSIPASRLQMFEGPFDDEASVVHYGTYRMDLIVRADIKLQK